MSGLTHAQECQSLPSWEREQQAQVASASFFFFQFLKILNCIIKNVTIKSYFDFLLLL